MREVEIIVEPNGCAACVYAASALVSVAKAYQHDDPALDNDLALDWSPEERQEARLIACYLAGSVTASGRAR